MVNRPKAIGTAAETAVVRAARRWGFGQAERRALHGSADVGDILLCPGIILEVKGGAAAKDASDTDIERWLDETDHERINAGADVAILVTQRRNVGAPNADRWWAWWRLGWLDQLRGLDYLTNDTPIRMRLDNALQILRTAGYGDPLETDDPGRGETPPRERARLAVPPCDHDDLGCPAGSCDWSGRDGRDG